MNLTLHAMLSGAKVQEPLNQSLPTRILRCSQEEGEEYYE
jgi:hypothetical protein